MAHRAGLARQAAARDGGRSTSYWPCAVGDDERLLDHQAQHRAGEIDFLIAAVDDDLAGAGLQPDAGDGVLALAGGIGAALLVELLLAQRGVAGTGVDRCPNSAAALRPSPERRAGAGVAFRSARSDRDRGQCLRRPSRGDLVLAVHRSDVERFGLLAGVRMLGAGIEVQRAASARGRAGRAGSCARRPFPARARGNGPRGSCRGAFP